MLFDMKNRRLFFLQILLNLIILFMSAF